MDCSASTVIMLKIIASDSYTLLNAAYVAWGCPHDLAPDEAHYWDWSRNLDWGYYSKGPLIAWLIRGELGVEHGVFGLFDSGVCEIDV